MTLPVNRSQSPGQPPTRDPLEAAIRALVDVLREELAAQAPASGMPDRLLNIAETSQITGLGRSKIYDLISSGELKSLRAGRRRCVAAGAIRDFIERSSE